MDVASARSFSTRARLKLRRSAGRYVYRVGPQRVECPICGWTGRHLMSTLWHDHVECPSCRSGIRHRLLWATVEHLEAEGTPLVSGRRVVHFAPEPALGRRLAEQAERYETADLLADGYHYDGLDHDLDISAMPSIESGSVGCLVALDVLEHVPDDTAALAEIARVLEPGGTCLLTVPQEDGRVETHEDLEITDPDERVRLFGQHDHLRIYGTDLADRIAATGLKVRVMTADDIDPAVAERWVLTPPVPSPHPLATNVQRLYVGVRPAPPA